ncbi:uncharacterized protein LOC134706142 [Mytilus trossulus]|uniref:uncharacterized protein LOC134706142 n=1 Tax=Mytilus trossulus TaxID=6551 RepID=UPI00300523BE
MADSKFCTGCQRGEEDVNAVAWCSDCSELVCKVVARVLERMSHPHKVIPMKEIQQLSSSLLNLSKNCENHPEEKNVLYCCQHDKVICDSCVTVSHQNCKPVISIEKAARGVKVGTAISALERRLDNLSQVTDSILSHSEATLEELTKSRNSIKKRVSEIKHKSISHLEKLEADIHKEIDNKYKHCNETVSRNKDNIQSSADSLSIWKNDLKSLRQHLSEIHLFQIVKFLDAKTHQKELEIREIQKATVPLLRYHPPESEANINKLLSDFGIIMVDNVPVPKPVVLDIDQQGQFLVRDYQKLSLTHSFKTTKLGDEVKVYRGCFIPDNRLLFGQYERKKLFVCKLDGYLLKIINLDYEPEYITLYDKNHAVVSASEKGIQIIDLTTLKPDSAVTEGITCVKDNIWIKNQSKTLTLVDINGKFLNTIQTSFDPWDICDNKDGDVYCTDRCSNKVFIVTSDGKEREIYSSPDLKNPIDNHGDVRSDSRFCAGCQRDNEDIKAVSWCSDCCELVCKKCARVHERMSSPHNVVPIKNIPLSSSLFNLSKNCEFHPEQRIVMYCSQHDKMVCDSCVPKSHPNCKPIISIEKAARGVKDGSAISDIERRIDNLSKVTENIVSQNEKTLEDLKESRDEFKQNVSVFKLNVAAQLNELEAETHRDIESKYMHCNRTVSKMKDNLQSNADSLSNWKRDFESLKQNTSENHLFQAIKFLDAKCHQKELEIRKIQTAPLPTLTYHPSDSESNIKNFLSDLGTITVDDVLVQMPALAIDQQGQCLVKSHGEKRMLSLVHSFQTTQLGDGVAIYRGAFVPGRRLVLGQRAIGKMFVCEFNGSISSKISLDYIPACLTMYDSNHVLVSGAKGGFQNFDLTTLSPGKEISIQELCRKINDKDCCRGITSVKKNIWIKNKSKTLTKVDINGKVEKTIKTTFDPWDICANEDGDLYCTDATSDKVYVVMSDGKEREIYNSPYLKGVESVAVDYRGDVYVAGKGSNNIHRISNDGQANIVLTANDGIELPAGLFFNNETGELLVINNNHKSINIFKYTDQ